MSDQSYEDQGEPTSEPDERWFQELPGLLHAYAAARREARVADPNGPAADIDTAQAPSPAMLGYLREAARHPGRATRVISEIERLLAEGPTDEVLLQLADAGISPERLHSSDEAEPAEHFNRMLPHLQRFVADGERAVSTPPQTPWEWKERFSDLGSLLGGQFYMYWQDEYDHEGALTEFIDALGSDPDWAGTILQNITDVRVAAPSEKSLEHAFRMLGFYGYPPEGTSWKQWLARVEERLREYVRDNT